MYIYAEPISIVDFFSSNRNTLITSPATHIGATFFVSG